MKMKKIISALVMGAAAAGIATADLSIAVDSKLASDMYNYNTTNSGKYGGVGNGADKYGSGTKNKELFNIGGYDGTGGNVTLTAKGNIFTFTAKLGTKSDTLDLAAKRMTVAANVGNFAFTTGWSRDGNMNVKMDGKTAGNDAGKLASTAYKLGSPFQTALWLSNNQWGFGKDPHNYFASAKYGLSLGDTLKLNLAASVLSPHGTGNSSNTTSSTDNVEGLYGRVDNTQMGWGVFVNPVIGKIVSLDLFAKGFGMPEVVGDGHNFLFGGYANLLCVPVLTNAVLGGSVWLAGSYGETHLMEWNIDLSLNFKLGDRILLDFNNKFAASPDIEGVYRGQQAAVDVGFGTKYTNTYLLWNVLGVSFKLNDTFTLIGTVGHQSGFGDGEKGTTIYVYPHAQVFANSKASVSAGAVLTLDRLGSKNFATDKMGLLINVPFVVKVAL